MKKLLLIICLISSYCYGQQNSVVTIKGEIQGIGNDTLYIWRYLTTDWNTIISDTITSKNNKFTYKLPAEAATVVAILPNKSFISRVSGGKYMPQGRFIELFVSPKENIKIMGKLEPLYLDYSVKGSHLNKEYATERTKYKIPEIEVAAIELRRDSLSAYPEKKEENNKLFNERIKKQSEVEAIKIKFINNHLNNDLSAYLLSRLSLKTFAELYPKLTEKVRQGYFKSMLEQQYRTYLDYAASKKAETELTGGTFAPDFKLTSVDGKQHSLSDFKGQIIVLDFWGTWCGPCVAEIPRLKSFHDSQKAKVKLIGIDCKDTKQDLIRMIGTHQIDWLQLINSEDNDASVMYGIMAYPTKIVIDKNFKIVKRFVGINDAFYQLLDELTK
ncbi:MAG: redoxin domain-containing protein [Bacteroidetes bacterium]|nr:redoxin domain-containing protein [Bacteroidota bacterium]MBS1592567.1 redoxin domain-containing protein [Bacteroidota bacterium]